jgi:hypothetical protein
MAIALEVDCHDWHREYCELYWKHNELLIIATVHSLSEARKVACRMNELVRLLGYVPAP